MSIFKRTKCFKFAETDGANKVEKSVLQSLTQKVDYGEKMRLLNEVSLSIWDSLFIYYHNTCPRVICCSEIFLIE